MVSLFDNSNSFIPIAVCVEWYYIFTKIVTAESASMIHLGVTFSLL